MASTHILLDHPTSLDADAVVLSDDLEHHLRRVLRLRDGERVSVTDGEGRWRMTAVRHDGTVLNLDHDGTVQSEPRQRPFTIAAAIPQGDRVEWLVQKTVELGVDRIVLLHAERSTVRWKPERAAKHLTRLQRIADEATRQSRRVWRTEVVGPFEALEVVADAAIAEPDGPPIRGDEPIIAVGPEGGWTPEEVDAASTSVGLSANILRVETAAVAATALRMVDGH